MAKLSSQARNLTETIAHISWYMRGGIQYQDAKDLTAGERDMLIDQIKKRLESQKGSMNPVY